MKIKSEEVEIGLRKKAIQIFSYISALMKARNVTQAELSKRMEVKEQYLSRLFRGVGKNITLETIAKFEKALDTDLIVTPLCYEEHLLNKTDRLLHLVSVALKHSPTLKTELTALIDSPKEETKYSLNKEPSTTKFVSTNKGQTVYSEEPIFGKVREASFYPFRDAIVVGKLGSNHKNLIKHPEGRLTNSDEFLKMEEEYA